MTPETIGSYKILAELGRGAMGVVYHAQDPKIGRPVAIKVIRIDPGATADHGAQLRQRLIREASAAGKLSHPGIVTVYQLGEEGTDVFVVMEYVDGSSLERLLANNPNLDRSWQLDILRQIGNALDYAHAAGVIHRDVKPANILVRGDGHVKVADFGIAKTTQSDTGGMTATGVSLGSPSYMSPEQVRAAQLDGRSDQFALGAIAYQMFTGRMPFAGETAHAVMYQIVTADPFASLPTENGLTPPVKAALARALAKDPTDRFETCAAFVRELGSAAAIAPATPQTFTAAIPPPPPPQTPPDRKKLIMILAGALCVVVVAVGMWLLLRSGTAPAAGPIAEPPLVTAIAEGRLDDAKKLISRRVDVNAANKDGTTALMQAAEGSAYLPNNAPAVELLLSSGAQVEAQDARGRTALYRATSEGKAEAVRLLLGRKADPNHKSSDGSTPVLAAIEFGRLPVLMLLLQGGGSLGIADNQGSTPLMIAAEGTAYMPNNTGFVQALLDRNPSVDDQDGRGRSALYRAAAEGKMDAVRLLLDAKANPNQKALDGSTPLQAAVTYGRLSTIPLLLERQATVDLADAQGNTALMIASEGTPYFPNNGPFVTMLLAANARVDTQDSLGRSALYRASAEGKEDAMNLLVDKGAHANLKAADGSTPLIAAVKAGKLGAMGLLLEHGADVNLADANGVTALMFAAETSPYIKSPADFIVPLLAHGAKQDAVDGNAQTALMRATTSKNAAAIELLKKK